MHIFFAKQVGGGTAVRPLLVAGIAAMALWGITMLARYLLDIPDWKGFVGVLTMASLTFLGFQYLLLRNHLTRVVDK
jgi:hypothetical protein